MRLNATAHPFKGRKVGCRGLGRLQRALLRIVVVRVIVGVPQWSQPPVRHYMLSAIIAECM
jgi:hypothetical protein